MTKRNEQHTGSLSFKDRTLSKAATKELFDTRSANTLSGVINSTVDQIKEAKATKVAKATDAYFAYSTGKSVRYGRNAKTGLFLRPFRLKNRKPETA